eukprot:390075-Rhodomonas_salina.1
MSLLLTQTRALLPTSHLHLCTNAVIRTSPRPGLKFSEMMQGHWHSPESREVSRDSGIRSLTPTDGIRPRPGT